MASEQQVKTYLAYWFQLGKKLLWRNEEKEVSQPIIQGDRFSEEFENCWQQIVAAEGKDYYLAGSNMSLEELLSPKWKINSCVRCDMPVPIIELGIQSLECPCSDLDNWPNLELPLPRSPVDSKEKLRAIEARLGSKF